MASKTASTTGPQLLASQPKQKVALPLHVQKLQQALDLGTFITQVEQVYNNSLKLVEISRKNVDNLQALSHSNEEAYHAKDFNFSCVTEDRQWVKDLLLSPSEGSDSELSDTEQLQILLDLQNKRRKKWKKRLHRGHKLLRYKYFSSGMLFCSKDPYPDHMRRLEDKLKKPVKKDAKTPQEREAYREKLWSFITKKEAPKMAKQFSMARHTTIINCKKVALLCQREVKKAAAKSQRASKEVSSVQPRARRLMKEALIYWRKYEKVEREQRKKAEKEAMEQRKRDDEMREAKRQQRKLNFLITQTELYAHFIGKKLTGEDDQSDKILKKLEDKPLTREVRPGVTVNLEGAEEYDSDIAKAQALANVQTALKKQQNKNTVYNELAKPGKTAEDLQESFDNTFSLATPMLQSDQELPQPQMFNGTLKEYQLKGMNWLANLYDQGINGILADEMGLGKTVQSVAFMAHLAEHQGIWGPFLIVSPASTLHNWQQECTRFVPKFKTLPYWGSPHERKIIRKYWNQKFLYNEHAPFHVLITSYQLVVQDVKYFQRVKWQYMILDEAQAIKSSNSIRWKVLLSFNCRNRLLLTGTPIQNTMQELWALLHFIMPSMFDSHEEFNEWFSRDIESHAEKKSVMDEHQLSRLHLILKPFMLRRIKKDVEHEMAEKIEVHLSCELSTRQKKLYQGVKLRISIDNLLQSSLAPPTSTNRDSTTSHLLNLVMQFRKVCNHPDLFERRNVVSPAVVERPTYGIPRLVYHTSLFPRSYRLTQLGIHATDHIHQSITPAASGLAKSLWSCFKLSGWSAREMSLFMLGGLADKLTLLFQFISGIHSIYHQRIWDQSRPENKAQLLLWPSFKLSSFSRASSCVLGDLVFVSRVDTSYAHLCHRTYPLRTSVQASNELSSISSTVSGAQDGDCGEPDTAEHSDDMAEACPSHEVVCWTKLPSFLFSYSPKVQVPWQPAYCSSRSAEDHRLTWVLKGGPPLLKDILLHGPAKSCLFGSGALGDAFHPVHDMFGGQSLAGLDSIRPPKGWSHIQIPDKESMIFDSGKMAVLDKLLVNLKREQHRVLIYSQMTRMIDLLEEFMGYRRYRYIRLDGSSKISDRRDMVADFQSNSEIFVFLLSTRAGGLGINLTAADTVIFYDSDWNPTVDQQAMDRAHRLGQTKQVTVYRLIVKGTIEEKILQRAREKSEIQKMVISGGDFRPDAMKAKEMVSLLLDDDEMETRFLAKQAEKKAILERIEQGKKAAKNKKRPRALNGKEPAEPSSKRAKVRGSNQHQLDVMASNTPSPSPLTLSTSRPTSVLSVASAAPDIPNGDDSSDHPGSTDGSEVNLEISGPGTTPVRKVPAKSKLGLHGITAVSAGGDSGGSLLQVSSLSPSPSTNGRSRRVKQTAAPLGGRGKMQKTVGKKGGGKGSNKGGASGSAAASAGAKAGAKAATDAAYAAYGIPISPSPVNSPAASGSLPSLPAAYNPSNNSTHSSPRVSPVPMAFVATSLVSTTPSSNNHPSPSSIH